MKVDPHLMLDMLNEFERMAGKREGQFSNPYAKSHVPNVRKGNIRRSAFEALVNGDLHGASARQALVVAWQDFYKAHPGFRPPSEVKRYRHEFRGR